MVAEMEVMIVVETRTEVLSFVCRIRKYVEVVVRYGMLGVSDTSA